MMSKILTILTLLSISYYFYSCSTRYNKTDDIYIRIHNQMGTDIERLWLGTRLSKQNSYTTTSYQTIYNNIPKDAESEYQATRGKFWGYHAGNGILTDSTRFHLRRRDVEQAILLANISLIDATMHHPYSEKIVTNKTLPDGKYTFVLMPKNGKKECNVRIIVE